MSDITVAEIQKAHQQIQHLIFKTPILTNQEIDETVSKLYENEQKRLFFKCEAFQRSGSFKVRGACFAVSSFSEKQAEKGVITHSSGNHGAAIAYAAKYARGAPIPAIVIVPQETPQFKIKNISKYGARVELCENTVESREQTCQQFQNDFGYELVHPYNDVRTITGQGTLGLEVMEQVRDADAVVVPVSGGGMISGVALAVKGINPHVKIIAAEPCGKNNQPDVWNCKQNGKLSIYDKPQTIADGLRGRLGDLTWPVVRDLVDAVIVVSEEEIVNAMKICYQHLKVVVEPSGAVGLAACLQKNPVFKDLNNICVILCGGNIDLDKAGLWQQWQKSIDQPIIIK
eukprot:TRINITY_DN2988_c0_g1_i9.p1 TRINITY_DN2988_c0_g1~~TRINITY_DN2988_c0_g1_i9.p1  ORF type:complete len:344 (-),score=55.43 TRINITY_DN2988_c0_g1_i9:167-1198(-)